MQFECQGHDAVKGQNNPRFYRDVAADDITRFFTRHNARTDSLTNVLVVDVDDFDDWYDFYGPEQADIVLGNLTRYFESLARDRVIRHACGQVYFKRDSVRQNQYALIGNGDEILASRVKTGVESLVFPRFHALNPIEPARKTEAGVTLDPTRVTVHIGEAVFTLTRNLTPDNYASVLICAGQAAYDAARNSIPYKRVNWQPSNQAI